MTLHPEVAGAAGGRRNAKTAGIAKHATNSTNLHDDSPPPPPVRTTLLKCHLQSLVTEVTAGVSNILVETWQMANR